MQLPRERSSRAAFAAAPGVIAALLLTSGTSVTGLAAPASTAPTAAFKQYCTQCHGKSAAGGINLEHLTTPAAMTANGVGQNFQHWEKVIDVLEAKRMPPKGLPQPGDAERGSAATWIRMKLREYARQNAGDPGRVTVRQLTSAEYGYTVRDLTGLDLKLGNDASADTVGGEGFTNYGDTQFMQDATVERYLRSAKRIADHAVIGAGPLEFFIDPGKSGLELSAVDRIQAIYRKYGFRAASGEGGKPYGLDRYSKALYAAWRYQHRKALGEPDLTLAALARREGLTERFLDHIWQVLNQPSAAYPTSDVVAKWRALPAPGTDGAPAKAMEGARGIQKFLIEWPRWLFGAGAAAEGGQGDERALVLTEASIEAQSSGSLRFFVRGRGKQAARFYLSTASVNPHSKDKPVVVWKNAGVRFGAANRRFGDRVALHAAADEETRKRLNFGKLPDGSSLAATDFATLGDGVIHVDVAVPEGTGAVELQVQLQMLDGGAGDAVQRCTLSDEPELSKGRPVSVLLAKTNSPGFRQWKAGVLAFAAALPQISHGEPTPSDKDPIPAPFNNTYNQPERDHYHTKLKYYREDRFLVEKMLDDETRRKLDHAWIDLLTSFEYHDAFLDFVAQKFKLNVKDKGIADLQSAEMEAMPEEPRKYVRALRAEYDAMVAARQGAQPGHVEDAIRLAARAWRRPLTPAEKDRLRAFYVKSREGQKLDHDKAMRALLSRVLVAPAFLYRLEQPSEPTGVKPLSGTELASRLSYFLWSSMPDEELMRAAAAGELNQTAQLAKQVKRMLSGEKARRMSTEFFGQWLGFYRFDEYRGVDTGRFPEFTDDLKSAMYDEAVSFFEHVLRKDKPVRDILFADYTFLNNKLAKHYGIPKEIKSAGAPELVEGMNQFHRGGLLRLGAVMTVTSAPLRTSPVKRGDWILRRILGTPTPPPPADAGSIPADDKQFGEMTVRERLAVHQRNVRCAGCHSRIDPLGFPLERYDPVGRWRETYPDGKPIHDSSELAAGTKIDGVDGLIAYMKAQEQQVLRNFAQKLIGYALGRTILASDQPLVDELLKAGGDANMSRWLTEIAASKQFRNRREVEESSAPTSQSASRIESKPRSRTMETATLNKQGGR
ncbi:MAG: DUF1592 domain-containing protein [Bryobacterales bacterium]|nr:DUF1592 domain-containing protein [Bryobacterales bacterium]